ncbi:hypothetical protein E2C01_053021 [Portunus trituberculatus]|uniref:Uncharacterized protein n=1 Tax=Portunus trituberculatus TaxID=210409 RepID=A0A5B7GNC3_PORTR|nr:hypothetical protein [Portunus trituberculatus]
MSSPNIQTESGLDIALHVIRETHEKIIQKYWSVTNRKCKEQKTNYSNFTVSTGHTAVGLLQDMASSRIFTLGYLLSER